MPTLLVSMEKIKLELLNEVKAYESIFVASINQMSFYLKALLNV
jgi:hypothetical protein